MVKTGRWKKSSSQLINLKWWFKRALDKREIIIIERIRLQSVERSTQLQQTEMLTTYLLHCWAARRSWKGLAYSTVSILPRTSDWCNWESACEVSWIILFEAEGWTSLFIYHVRCRVLFVYIPYICILIIFFLFFWLEYLKSSRKKSSIWKSCWKPWSG